MLLVSHYLHLTTPVHFPKEKVVLRINVAWMKNKKELLSTLRTLEHDIYLDYPQGRSKPPKPTLPMKEVIAVAHQFPNVKYFAVSNVEDPEDIFAIKSKLPVHIDVVPKIETKTGVKNLEKIMARINGEYAMLDKEDLYSDVGRNSKKFDALVSEARKKSIQYKFTLLELHGVVFLPYGSKKNAGKKRNVS